MTYSLSDSQVRNFLKNKKKNKFLNKSIVSIKELNVPLSFEELHFYKFKEHATIQNAHHLFGPLNTDALIFSFESVVSRHETLRTVFFWDSEKLIRNTIDPGWFRVKTVKLDENARQKNTFTALIKQQASIDYEVMATFRQPLFMVTLISVSENHHILLLTVGHMIFDGLSFDILYRELSQLYDACQNGVLSPLNKWPVQYSEFIIDQQRWYETEDYKKIEKYWSDRFSDLPASINLPVDHLQTTLLWKIVSVDFPEQLYQEFFALGRQAGATQFTIWLSLVSVLIAQYTNQSDVFISYLKSSRLKSEYSNVIGVFSDPFLFRSQVDMQFTFSEFVEKVKFSAFNDYARMKMPSLLLKDILENKFESDVKDLFHVSINFLPDICTLKFEGVEVERLPFDHVMDLTVNKISRVSEGDAELRFFIDKRKITLWYNSDQYEDKTIKNMSEFLTVFMSFVVSNPEVSMKNILSSISFG